MVVLFAAGGLSVRAQVEAVVFDIETKRPIEGATVYVNPGGSVKTDVHGRFAVEGECNSITVACQGYESLSMAKENVPDTLWMLPDGHSLDELVVYGRKPKLGFDMDKVSGKKEKRLENKSGIGGLDFFHAVQFKKRKQAKRRKKIKEMLDDY